MKCDFQLISIIIAVAAGFIITTCLYSTIADRDPMAGIMMRRKSDKVGVVNYLHAVLPVLFELFITQLRFASDRFADISVRQPSTLESCSCMLSNLAGSLTCLRITPRAFAVQSDELIRIVHHGVHIRVCALAVNCTRPLLQKSGSNTSNSYKSPTTARHSSLTATHVADATASTTASTTTSTATSTTTSVELLPPPPPPQHAAESPDELSTSKLEEGRNGTNDQ
jgi:hypothetical protein